MARDVTVRLSAEVQAYLSAMQQAEQATSRVADAADRLGDISISADSSVAADLDQAASAADGAASSMEGAAGAAEGMSGGMESAGASAESASAGLDSAGASAQVFSSNLDGSGASSQDFAASLATVGAQSQAVAGDMSAASAATETFSSNLDGSGAASQSFAASLASVGAQSQSAAVSMSSVSAAAQGYGGSLGDAVGAGQSFLQTAQGMRSEFTSLGGALAVAGGGLAALMGNVIQTGIQYNTLQQVAGRALETMTGSAEAAAEQMARLHAFADESPFARDTWITAQQQLMAFGMEAERIVPTLEGVQNAVAAIGGGDNEIMQLVDILGQVEGQGRITGRELQRLGQMGINAADLIGEAMGVSGNEIRTQITAGALDAETAITALTEGMMTRFDGAAEGLRDTMEGALDRIRARIRDIGSLIATPLVDPSGGGFLVEAINQAADFGSLLLNNVHPALIQIVGLGAAAAGGISIFGGAIVAALPHLSSFLGNIRTAWSAIRDFGSTVITGAGGLRGLGIAAGVAAAAFAGFMIIRSLTGDVEDFTASVSELHRALSGSAFDSSAVADFAGNLSGLGRGIDDLGDAMSRQDGAINSFGRWGAELIGVTNSVTVADEAIRNLDQAITESFNEGDFERAANGFQTVVDEAEALGWSTKDIVDSFPQMTSAIRDAATQAGQTVSDYELLRIATSDAALEALAAGESWRVIENAFETGTYHASAYADAISGIDIGTATSGMGSLTSILMEQADAAGEAASELDRIVQAYTILGMVHTDAEIAVGSLQQSIRELSGVVEENGYSLDTSTDAGLANAQAFSELRDEAFQAASAVAAAGGSAEEVAAPLHSMYDALVEQAIGLTGSKEAAEAYVDAMLGIPEEHSTEYHFENFAEEAIDAAVKDIGNLPDQKDITLQANVDDAAAAMDAFIDGDYEAIAQILGQDEEAQGVVWDFINDEYIAQVDVDGNTTPADEAMAAFMNRDYEAVAQIMGDDEQAQEVMLAFLNGDHEALAEIIGDADDAQAVMQEFLDQDYATVADILGDSGMAWNAANEFTSAEHQAIIQLMGDDTPARGVIDALIGGDYNTLVDILGDDSLARQVMNAFTSGEYQAVADLLANDSSARQTVGTFTATQWQTFIEAIANTGSANAALNALTRSRTAMINVVTSGVGAARSAVSRAAANARARVGLARGGIAPASTGLAGYSTGGRLPHTGLGTDMILGVNGAGMPVARVDDGEFVTNRASTRRHESLLWAVNNNDLFGMRRYLERLPAHAGGGHAGYTGPVREFAQPRQTGFDYNRLAHAMSSRDGGDGGTVQFNITTNNPVAEKTSASVSAGLEAIGAGYMPSEVNHV